MSQFIILLKGVHSYLTFHINWFLFLYAYICQNII